MNNIDKIKQEIEEIIECLVKHGMSVCQQYPIKKKERGEITTIAWGTITNLSISLKNLEYDSIYSEIDKNRDYTIKLIDGNMIQMLYTFKGRELYSHRLATFPSPTLEAFQNQPEIYERDDLYADIISRRIVSFPIRFDYNKEDIDSKHEHPYSHVTLGQYSNCRIPAYGPISPMIFMNFILENFYNTYYLQCYKINNMKNKCHNIFTAREEEKKKLYFNIG